MVDLYSLESYDYFLPQERIAQFPLEKRDAARLLIVDRKTGSLNEALVSDIPDLLQPSDLLICNDTKVLHARLYGSLASGKKIECLLSEKIDERTWLVIVKGARFLQKDTELFFPQNILGKVLEVCPDGMRIIHFSKIMTPILLQEIGSIPLPPYMQREAISSIDSKRYQTVYADTFGSVAAPTAGLHFTKEIFEKLEDRRIDTAFITLHVGSGTFLPIRKDAILEHTMHEERYEIPEKTAQRAQDSRYGRKIAVGTTTTRCLESCFLRHKQIVSGAGSTNLFITPGFQFQVIDALFTNFHTPKSSLLVLVASFMGYDLMKEVYAKAIERKFRFFSYGDAMLIL